jgi:hypothetical protein
MKHLNQEELIEHYYSEDEDFVGAMVHLDECADCAVAYLELKSDLSDLTTAEVPPRDSEYGRRMWERLSDSLPTYEAKPSRPMHLSWWRGLGYAAACAALISGAFFAGRVWEQRQPRPVASMQVPAPQVKQRVVVVVLGDHLDRSERLLVQLKHVDSASDEMVTPLRDEARSLLAANEICRQDAEKTGNPALEKALNHLDRLLNELAKKPGGVSSVSIARLQREMNVDGLLFEVRVLRTRIPGKPTHNQGGSI